MPFYIFKISTEHTIEYLGEEEKYPSARKRIRDLRAADGSCEKTTYRMVFAASVGQGERLLSTSQREDGIIGDD